jgi:UDP-N-acetylglucosamine 2-epimerase (non-hydrolysing)
MLDQVLQAFAVVPDIDLDVMRSGQTLYQSTARILSGLDVVMAQERPDIVFVQGDTTSTFCGALAAFYARTRVGHVEAGLRTGSMHEPFPEEMNRVLTTRLATLHFAPTENAANNLRGEGVAARNIFVTGNTSIDAVLEVARGIETGRLNGLGDSVVLDSHKKLVVVTAHRRESFGSGMEGICAAILRLASREDVQIVYPVHPNPHVRCVVYSRLDRHPNVVLTEPLPYVAFIDLMRRADVLLTDSGGIQEEGPALGKPVVVMRDKTERPEGVSAGMAVLVGTAPEEITRNIDRVLDGVRCVRGTGKDSNSNPYGDGRASMLIAQATIDSFRLQ